MPSCVAQDGMLHYTRWHLERQSKGSSSSQGNKFQVSCPYATDIEKHRYHPDRMLGHETLRPQNAGVRTYTDQKYAGRRSKGYWYGNRLKVQKVVHDRIFQRKHLTYNSLKADERDESAKRHDYSHKPRLKCGQALKTSINLRQARQKRCFLSEWLWIIIKLLTRIINQWISML